MRNLAVNFSLYPVRTPSENMNHLHCESQAKDYNILAMPKHQLPYRKLLMFGMSTSIHSGVWTLPTL